MPTHQALDWPAMWPEFSSFRKGQGIINVDAKIALGMLDVGMAQQDLNVPQVSNDDRAVANGAAADPSFNSKVDLAENIMRQDRTILLIRAK